MNLMSSMANTFVGSVIAIVSVAPDRESGMIWYFCAVSAGTSLTTVGIDVELPEGDRRHAVLLAQESGDLVVFDEPELDQIEAELPPVLALIVQRLLELLRRDALLFEKQLSDSNRHEKETGLSHVNRQNVTRAPMPQPLSSSAPPNTPCPSTKIPERTATLAPTV